MRMEWVRGPLDSAIEWKQLIRTFASFKAEISLSDRSPDSMVKPYDTGGALSSPGGQSVVLVQPEAA